MDGNDDIAAPTTGAFVLGAAVLAFVSVLLIWLLQPNGETTAGAHTAPSEVSVPACVLLDTRTHRSIVDDEVRSQRVTGANGACTVPSWAVGVVLEVEAAGRTAASDIAVYAADAAVQPRPQLHVPSGNWPVRSRLRVPLSRDGHVAIGNRGSDVDVVIRVIGYHPGRGGPTTPGSAAVHDSTL